MKFSMPYGTTLEIRPSRDIGDDQIGMFDHREGLTWHIWWGDIEMPFSTQTQHEAMALAYGVQWGAYEMTRRSSDIQKL